MRQRVRFETFLLGVAVAGCGGSPTLEQGPKTPSVETDQQATCRAAKDPMNPLVVEWPGTAKTALQSASQRGLVVVSYQGCVMKVLAGCDAGGRYQLQRVTPSQEHLEIDTEDKLYAELPLGVAKLKGYLEEGARLSLEYVSVGQQVADGQPYSLQGSCQGATHYVRAMTVGAYSLDASAAKAAGASGGVAAVGTAGAETKGSTRHLRGAGDLATCKAQPEGVGCEAVLQLSLEPLPKQTPGPVEGGFGRGLGGLASLPTLTETRDLVVGQDLAKADPALLRLVQGATRAEKDESLNAHERSKLWATVASYSPQHAFKTPATKRSEEWARVAVVEAQRARKAQQVCDRRVKDAAKVRELLSLDDEVVSKTQKEAYQREYDRAYAPFSEILKSCDTWRARASEAWVAEVIERHAKQEAEESARTEREKEHTAKAKQEEQNALSRREDVRTWKKIGFVGGGVLLGAGSVLLIVGYAKSKSAKSDCVGLSCPPSAEDPVNQANLLGNIGLVGLGVGAAVFLSALVWPEPEVPRSRGRIHFSTGPGTAGLSTSLTF